MWQKITKVYLIQFYQCTILIHKLLHAYGSEGIDFEVLDADAIF